MREDSKLVTLARLDNEHEAHLLRLELNNHGIPAVVAGNTVGFGLNNNLSIIQVNIRQIDQAAAEAVVKTLRDKIRSEHSGIGEWTCSCRVTVDAGFYVCWSCGLDYEDIYESKIQAVED